MVPTRVADRSLARERFAATPAAERFDVAIVAASATDDDAATARPRAARSAGDAGVFVIALLDIGERIARRVGRRPAAGLRRRRRRPIKQSRLYDALAGIQAERGPAEAADAEAPPGALAGLQVLIAEDNPVNQQVLLRQVQRLGIVAEAVDNGQEALDALERAQLRRGPDGLPDAGDGRLRGDPRDPRARARAGGGCRSSR